MLRTVNVAPRDLRAPESFWRWGLIVDKLDGVLPGPSRTGRRTTWAVADHLPANLLGRKPGYDGLHSFTTWAFNTCMHLINLHAT